MAYAVRKRIAERTACAIMWMQQAWWGKAGRENASRVVMQRCQAYVTTRQDAPTMIEIHRDTRYAI